MIGLYEMDMNSACVRLDDIERIGPPRANKHGVEQRWVELRGETGFHTTDAENGGLLARAVHLISAEPGCSVIEVGIDQEEAFATRARVIAWALCLDGEVRPVTACGVQTSGGRRGTYVEMPDGSIEGVGEWVEPWRFNNVEAMQAHFLGLVEDPRR